MKIKRLFIGILSLLAFFENSSAIAGNRPGAFTLTLADSYYFFSIKRNLQNTSVPNAAISYNFNQQLAAEVSAGVINTNQKGRLGTLAVHGFVYTLDGLYRFHPYKFVEPYLVAGIGAIGLKPNGTSPVNQANINAGIGTQLFIDRSIAFRVEAKDLYTMGGGKNDVMVNLGMSFLMG